MGKIYNSSGWVDWDYIDKQEETFIAMVGPRGVGKTYGRFRTLIERGGKFIYLRRLKSQLDLCSKPEGNPFRAINNDLDMHITPYPSGGIVTFRKGDKTGDIVAVGLALSVVANIRGIDLSDYDYIVFDEFIASIGEHPIKNEYAAFQNFYETVNRNREILGKKPVKCFMLGNANTIVNPYFSAWHFMKTCIKMITSGQMVYRTPDKTRMIIMLLNSPISEQKRETVLYKNASSDFITMALDNAFRTDETNIKSEPIAEYQHIVSCGDIGIWKHKTDRKYYVSSIQGQPYYDSFGISLKMFQNDFFLLRSNYMVNKNFYFESFELEIIFRELFNLN